jgi:hypothetical protein
MSRRTLVIVTFIALASVPGPTLARRGSAKLITFGRENAPGVEANAQGFSAGFDSGSLVGSSSSTLDSSARPVADVVDVILTMPTPNRCVAIEPTTDTFGLFSSSPSCTSFAPPAPAASGGRPGRGRRPAPPSPEQLAAIAADRAMDLAQNPALEIAPSRIGLTGLDSFFWLAEEPRPVRATASAGGLSVTAEARPAQYVWDFGDGTDKVTDEPGRAWTRWRDGTVAHMYETRARYEVAVEVVWSARWRSGAGAWVPLGFFSNSDTREYPVRQMIAMLVRAR